MSCIYKGQVIESELSKRSNGGTEMMRQRLLDTVEADLLSNFAIHLSRPREMYTDVPNILWCHDLAEDPENNILADGGWEEFDHFVFVSQWQRDNYNLRFGIPFSKCSVIPNAVEIQYQPRQKQTETINFIYHTTPHRGLELLVPVFKQLANEFENIHLNVYSSFKIYGWENRDEPYKKLFDEIDAHPKMTNHGTVDNATVIEALENSHIFLYPNIWRETSCIALIEAIKCGVICIHPNHGALSETAAQTSIMYDMTEDANKHANLAYAVAKGVLNLQKNDGDFHERFTTSDRFNLARNSINSFSSSWFNLLRAMLQNG
jgi:glycosyltransferase involved in cell wall biosynthesis